MSLKYNFCIALIFALNSNCFAQKGSYVIDTTCTPVEFILQIEQEEGNKIDVELYNWLDSLLDVSIKIKKHYHNDTLEFCKGVNALVLEEANRKTSYFGTLGQCLEYKYFDCDIISLVMVSLLEVNGISLYPYWNESHMWLEVNNSTHWETTSNEPTTLNQIMYKYLEDDTEFDSKSNYYKPLNKKDLIAWAYFTLSAKQFSIDNYEKALLYCFKTIEFSEDWAKPFALLGDAYWKLNDFNKAETAFLIAYDLFPYDKKLRERLHDFYIVLGCYDEAERL